MSIGLSGNRIQLWVILVHLQELSTVWIVNKVKSVRSWSGKTKYLISFIVFKHKMNVMLLDFLISIESLWNHKVVGCLLCLERIKIERRWGWSDVNLTSFHLRSYCPNRAVTTKLVLSLNFSILKPIKQQKEKIFILRHVFPIDSFTEVFNESFDKLFDVRYFWMYFWCNCSNFIYFFLKGCKKIFCSKSDILTIVVANTDCTRRFCCNFLI